MVSRINFDRYGHVMPSHHQRKEDLPYFSIRSPLTLEKSRPRRPFVDRTNSVAASGRRSSTLSPTICRPALRANTQSKSSRPNPAVQRHTYRPTEFESCKSSKLSVFLSKTYKDVLTTTFGIIQNMTQVSGKKVSHHSCHSPLGQGGVDPPHVSYGQILGPVGPV